MIRKQYLVMQGEGLDDLEAEVDECLNDATSNWRLYGDMVISPNGTFYQPMINEWFVNE